MFPYIYIYTYIYIYICGERGRERERIVCVLHTMSEHVCICERERERYAKKEAVALTQALSRAAAEAAAPHRQHAAHEALRLPGATTLEMNHESCMVSVVAVRKHCTQDVSKCVRAQRLLKLQRGLAKDKR